MIDEIGQDLAAAFDRVDDFLAVQAAGGKVSLEAVERLQSAVGIEADTRRLFKERLDQVSSEGHSGAVLLGLILGLFAAQEVGQ